MPPKVTDVHAAAHFAMQIADPKNASGTFGPDAQALYDFCDAMSTHAGGSGKRTNRSALFDALGDETRMMFQRLFELAAEMKNKNMQKARELLKASNEDFKKFTRSYNDFKKKVPPDLIAGDPVLANFDRIWTKRDFHAGDAFVDEAIAWKKAQNAKKGEAVPGNRPEAPNKPAPGRESGSAPPQEAPNAPEDEMGIPDEPLNINVEIVEQQRAAKQLNRERVPVSAFRPGNTTYEGVLGSCEHEANNRQGTGHTNQQLAIALAATTLRREGKPFNLQGIRNLAERISGTSAFQAMTRNREFVYERLTMPERMDETLKLFERELKAERQRPQPRNYENYLRLHTWPNVPEGMERDCLAKVLAANSLQKQGAPFDLETLHSEADRIRKSKAFKTLTVAGQGESQAALDETVRRCLYRENIPAFEARYAARRKSYLNRQKIERNQNIKSWAGYLRMHTGRNVPENATPEQKRLYLAKVLVACRAMADDRKFDLSAARKSAKKLMDNPHFKAVTRDIQAVDKVLFAKPKSKPAAEGENAPRINAPADELRINEDPSVSANKPAAKKRGACPLNPNISAANKLFEKMDEARNRALSRKLWQSGLIEDNSERPKRLSFGDAPVDDGDTPRQETPGGYSLGL